MYHLKGQYARDLYLRSLQEVVDFGNPVQTRGRKFLEILDVSTEITSPQHHCILLPSRRWNPWIAMSEALWILAGRNDIAALRPYNKRIKDFSDDGKTLYGAYGYRIFDQIDPLIKRLRNDPGDRRAVLQIWDQHNLPDQYNYENDDLETTSKDPPCNNLIYFKLRDGELHMTVCCRSNDIHWGLYAVNIPTFGILQEYIASRLGVNLGHQTHISNSFHVYTDDPEAVKITDRMLYKEPEDRPAYPLHGYTFYDLYNIESHTEFSKMCDEVLEGYSYNPKFPPFLNFASSFLAQYQSKEFDSDKFEIDHKLQFADWILAGQIFAEKVWKQPVRQR